jgi:hypothetical protein
MEGREFGVEGLEILIVGRRLDSACGLGAIVAGTISAGVTERVEADRSNIGGWIHQVKVSGKVTDYKRE